MTSVYNNKIYDIFFLRNSVDFALRSRLTKNLSAEKCYNAYLYGSKRLLGKLKTP